MKPTKNRALYKLEIFIPRTHLGAMREALRAAGAGELGQYDSAMSYSPVTGCWRPLPGANPYDGTVGELREAEEYKIEVCCLRENLAQTVAAARAAHPYEQPVINAIALLEEGF